MNKQQFIDKNYPSYGPDRNAFIADLDELLFLYAKDIVYSFNKEITLATIETVDNEKRKMLDKILLGYKI